jgi:transcriptional regulator with XRE-family HTH domain
VFSRGRLRAYRDLAGLTRDQLATNTRLPVAVIIGYEEGTAPPTDAHLSTLADALTVTTAEFTGPPDADDSWEYCGLICAAMPPMTTEQIASVAVVLRRIDQQRHNADTAPDDPATARPEAA